MPEVPEGEKLDYGSAACNEFEEIGACRQALRLLFFRFRVQGAARGKTLPTLVHLPDAGMAWQACAAHCWQALGF